MSPEKALQNLYQAARMAPMPAEQHELVLQSAQVLQKAITPKLKEEEVAPKNKKNEVK